MKTRWQFWVALVLCLGTAFAVRAQYVIAKDLPVSYCTLYGEVNGQSTHDLIGCIEVANRATTDTAIVLYINSPGGSVFDGGMIVDAMISSRRPIVTVDVGYAASMAAYIWTYGTKRYVHPHAMLMFHQATASIDGSESQLEGRVRLLHRITAEYRAHLVSLVGDEATKHNLEEWWLLPEDAVTLHLADGILIEGDYPPPSE